MSFRCHMSEISVKITKTDNFTQKGYLRTNSNVTFKKIAAPSVLKKVAVSTGSVKDHKYIGYSLTSFFYAP